MKKLFVNGKFYVEDGVFAEAVLVEGNKFAKVGTDAEVRAAAGDDAEVIDCGGKTVIPGINDSHCHGMFSAKSLSYVPILGSKSIDEVIQRGKDFLAAHPNAKALRGMGWNVVDFVEGEQRNLRAEDLDKISTEIPITFNRACGHMMVANTKAMELVGIDENTPDPAGGAIERDENGKATGRFLENANSLFYAAVPEPGLPEIVENFHALMKHANECGITSIQSNDVGLFDNEYAAYFDALHGLHDAGELTVRFHGQNKFETPEHFEEFVLRERADSRYDDVLSFGPLKLIKDGSIGGHSALMREPYLDKPDTKGVEVRTNEELAAFYKKADELGVQVVVHCIGDGAIEKTLEELEKVLHDGKNPLRHGIIHCQIMDRELMERIKKDEVLSLGQPIFLHSDMHALATRIPVELARTSNAYRSMMEMGIPQSFGTDAPVEDINPFPCIYCAVARKDLRGLPAEGYFAEEALTVAEAVDCYTIASAYTQFMEDRKGRIKEGFLADLAVLDTDIFTCDVEAIKDTKSVMTVMDGKVVYQA